MEQQDDNPLFRWFVGLTMDASVWDATVFTKNCDWLLGGDVAATRAIRAALAPVAAPPGIPTTPSRCGCASASREPSAVCSH